MSLRKRRSVIDKISAIQVANIRSPDRKRIHDIYEEYLDSAVFTEEQTAAFHTLLDDRLIANVSEYVEPRMATSTLRVAEVEDLIEKQPFEDIRDLLWSLLDTWKLKYITPVVDLAELVGDTQNIHTTDVEKKTTDGVLLLGKVAVPVGQKTLVEIEAELRRILCPVKCTNAQEMFAYLSSHMEKYAVYPEELKKLLREAYMNARECKSCCVIHSAYASKWAHTFVEYNTTNSVVYYFGNRADEKESDGNEKESDGNETDETEINSSAPEGSTCSAPVDDNDVLAYFARADYPPAHSTSMLYSTYYSQFYEEFYAIDAKIKSAIEDMQDWGKRPSVMKKNENVYKTTLRGLWAKIKTFEPEIRDELIKRLFEEATEAIGLCADGHVGRLCNVLVGFDPEFTSSLSPMEYFQNNIALIAENVHALRDTKILQAKALMDDIKMPEEERDAWLEAL